jgi:hypothetical protein
MDTQEAAHTRCGINRQAALRVLSFSEPNTMFRLCISAARLCEMFARAGQKSPARRRARTLLTSITLAGRAREHGCTSLPSSTLQQRQSTYLLLQIPFKYHVKRNHCRLGPRCCAFLSSTLNTCAGLWKSKADCLACSPHATFNWLVKHSTTRLCVNEQFHCSALMNSGTDLKVSTKLPSCSLLKATPTALCTHLALATS